MGKTEPGHGHHTVGYKIVGINLQHLIGSDHGTCIAALIELQLRDAHPWLLARRISFSRLLKCANGGPRFSGRHLGLGETHRGMKRDGFRPLRHR